MKVIVPCCGSSSRFPGQPPKWTLPGHDGRPMICLAVAGLRFSLEDLVVTILHEHEAQYRVIAGLEAACGRPVRVVVLNERTRSQSETVARTIEQLGLDEPFLVKDSDGGYRLEELEQPQNYVCVASLNDVDTVNPRSKSYVQVDASGAVTNIREKVVLSDLFNVGGYYFTSPAEFMSYYRRLASDAERAREIYLSDVIGAMLAEGIAFRARRVGDYQDWGTAREWRRALAAKQAYFVSLDGFVFERGSRYFAPRFEDVKPQQPAVDAVRAIAAAGHRVIYLSIRPAECQVLTQRQLQAAGLPPGQVIWNCPVAPWVMVTSPHPTLPLPGGKAVELPADAAHLREALEGGANLD